MSSTPCVKLCGESKSVVACLKLAMGMAASICPVQHHVVSEDGVVTADWGVAADWIVAAAHAFRAALAV